MGKKSKNSRRSNKPRGTGTEPRQPTPPSAAPNLATATETGATLAATTPSTSRPLRANPNFNASGRNRSGQPVTYVSNTAGGACAPFSVNAAGQEADEKNPLPWVVAYRHNDFDYVVSHEQMLLKKAKEAKNTHFVLMHLFTIGRCHLMSYVHYKKRQQKEMKEEHNELGINTKGTVATNDRDSHMSIPNFMKSDSRGEVYPVIIGRHQKVDTYLREAIRISKEYKLETMQFGSHSAYYLLLRKEVEMNEMERAKDLYKNEMSPNKIKLPLPGLMSIMVTMFNENSRSTYQFTIDLIEDHMREMNHLEQKPNNDFASKQMLCNFITYYAGSLEGVGDYVMAKTVLIKQLHLARLVESYDKESRALSSMSKNWIRLGDYEKALDTLHACSDILSLDFKKRNQRVREEMGVLGAQLCQGLDQLPHNPSKGQVEFSKMDHSYMYAANAAKIGDVLKHQAMDKHGRIKSKDREKIISYYRQAIDHLEEGEDKIRKGLTEEGDFHLDSVHMGQANFLRQMAVQQGSGGRYEEALKNLYKAIDVSHKCKANDSDICNALAWKAAGKVAMDMWFEYDSKHGKSKSTSMSMTSRSRSRSRSSSPMDGQQMSDVGGPMQCLPCRSNSDISASEHETEAEAEDESPALVKEAQDDEGDEPSSSCTSTTPTTPTSPQVPLSASTSKPRPKFVRYQGPRLTNPTYPSGDHLPSNSDAHTILGEALRCSQTAMNLYYQCCPGYAHENVSTLLLHLAQEYYFDQQIDEAFANLVWFLDNSIVFATSCFTCNQKMGEGVVTKECGGCKSAFYCTSVCQKEDWKNIDDRRISHRSLCPLLRYWRKTYKKRLGTYQDHRSSKIDSTKRWYEIKEKGKEEECAKVRMLFVDYFEDMKKQK